VVQKTRKTAAAELVVITDQVLEQHFRDALTILKEMSMVKEISSLIRVY